MTNREQKLLEFTTGESPEHAEIARLKYSLWLLSNPWNWKRPSHPCMYAAAVLKGEASPNEFGLTEQAQRDMERRAPHVWRKESDEHWACDTWSVRLENGWWLVSLVGADNPRTERFAFLADAMNYCENIWESLP